jgi:hypothetical protein
MNLKQVAHILVTSSCNINYKVNQHSHSTLGQVGQTTLLVLSQRHRDQACQSILSHMSPVHILAIYPQRDGCSTYSSIMLELDVTSPRLRNLS